MLEAVKKRAIEKRGLVTDQEFREIAQRLSTAAS